MSIRNIGTRIFGSIVRRAGELIPSSQRKREFFGKIDDFRRELVQVRVDSKKYLDHDHWAELFPEGLRLIKKYDPVIGLGEVHLLGAGMVLCAIEDRLPVQDLSKAARILGNIDSSLIRWNRRAKTYDTKERWRTHALVEYVQAAAKKAGYPEDLPLFELGAVVVENK